MSDNDTAKAKSTWTDKERLTYLFALIDNSECKFNYNTTPRPAGRSAIACHRMVERLKGTLKNELEALKNGVPLDEGKAASAAKTKGTPRKRKGKDADVNGDAGASPSKKGRSKKVVSDPQVEDDDEELKVKAEVEDEA